MVVRTPGRIGLGWQKRPFGPARPRPLTDRALAGAHLEKGTTEFVHPLETLLGELCRSGFVIEGVTEPPRGNAWAAPGSPAHRACRLPPYLKLKARRR